MTSSNSYWLPPAHLLFLWVSMLLSMSLSMSFVALALALANEALLQSLLEVSPPIAYLTSPYLHIGDSHSGFWTELLFVDIFSRRSLKIASKEEGPLLLGGKGNCIGLRVWTGSEEGVGLLFFLTILPTLTSVRKEFQSVIPNLRQTY